MVGEAAPGAFVFFGMFSGRASFRALPVEADFEPQWVENLAPGTAPAARGSSVPQDRGGAFGDNVLASPETDGAYDRAGCVCAPGKRRGWGAGPPVVPRIRGFRRKRVGSAVRGCRASASRIVRRRGGGTLAAG